MQNVVSQCVTCTKCGLPKPGTLEYFPTQPAKNNGLDSWCRDCFRLRAKLVQQERRRDPEQRLKVLEEKRRYAESDRGRLTKRLHTEIDNHKRKTRRLGKPWLWNQELWTQCKEDWEHKCVYCGNPSKLTQEHFINLRDPNSPGTVPWNMLPACRSCNASKLARDPFEFVKSKTKLTRIKAYLASKKPSDMELENDG